MTIRKPKGTYPNTGHVPPASVGALRRRAQSCRDRADALEAMLAATQAQFAASFSAADAQSSTRDRISDAARNGRRLGARSVR